VNDRPVTCRAFGPAVLSWEADGDRIVIPMVLLYMESRVGLISRKKEAGAWPSILKGRRVSTSRAK
jgi:hypothetical protein